MRTLNTCKQVWPAIAAALLLAGCASTPAPVVNHSFGPGEPAAAQSATTSAQPTASKSSVQTFGLGGHANGTTSAAGYTVAHGDTLYSIAFAHGIDFRTLAAENGIPEPYTIHPGQVLKLKPAQASSTPAPIAAAPLVQASPPAAHASVTSAAPTAAVPAQPTGPVFGPVTTQTMTAAGVSPTAASSTPSIPPTATAPAMAASVAATPAATPAPTLPVATPPPAPVATATPPPGATRNVAGIVWRWPASGKLISGFQSGGGGDAAGLNIAGNLGDPVRAAASGTVVYSGNGLIGYGELIIIKHNDTYLSAYGHNSKRLVKEGQRVDAGQEIALMGASGAPRVELHFEIRKDGKPVDPLGYLPAK